MKIFMDTEFIEDGKTIDLLSIGMVREDGKELYLENMHARRDLANKWVRDNVLPYLHDLSDKCVVNRMEMGYDILEFVGGPDPEKWDQARPEFWAYYADYDWVAFCQIFGTMMDLPSGFPKYCRDIKQYCDSLGNPKLPTQGKGEHNALADARWNKQAYDFLVLYESERRVQLGG